MLATRIAVLLVTLAVNAEAARAGMLKPGDPFPSWKLLDHTGTMVSSSDYAGKTYLLWYYPKAMTSGCTAEGRGLRDHIEELRSMQIAVLGVSFDDPATNAEFVRHEDFPFQLLSDQDHKLATEVGAALIRLQPVSSRVSYLVGPSGKVLKAYGSVDPSTHAEEVIRDVRSLAPK